MADTLPSPTIDATTAAAPVQGSAPESPWPVLTSARAQWDDARDRLRKLGSTPAERTALDPLLRRRAVLDAAAANDREVGRWLGPVILILLAALPTITKLAAGADLDLLTVLGAYKWYLAALCAWIFAIICALSTIVPVLEALPQWLAQVVLPVLVVAATAGMVLLFGYVHRSGSSPAAAFFAAGVFHIVTVLLLVLDVPRAKVRHRRRYGALGLSGTAALILLAEWELLAGHRRNWRTGVGRRRLTKELRALIRDGEAELVRSADANHGDSHGRRWAEQYVVRLATAMRGHYNQLLMIDQQRSYDELVATVRRTTAELADGGWDAIGSAGDVLPRMTWRRRLARFYPAAVLGLAALFAGALPGIGSADLVTVRLSLLIPAALSLLPVGQLGQSTLSDAFRDAIGRIKS
jgi:hypothetical protein